MDPFFSSTLVTGIITVSITAIVVCSLVVRYKLKKEQIKADAMVKVEEVHARNRLELEQLMSTNEKQSNPSPRESSRLENDSRSIREKIKE